MIIIDLILSIDEKSDNNDIIQDIVNCLIKIVYHKSVKIFISLTYLVKGIIDIVIKYYNLLKSIISNRSFLF